MFTNKLVKSFLLLSAVIGIASDALAQTSVYTVGSVSEMIALNPSTYPNVYVRGRYTSGDGGGGYFRVNTSSLATNNGTIFAGAGSYSNRRWIRDYTGVAEAKWWGFDGGSGDYAKLTNMLNAVDTIHFGKGTYRVSTNVDVLRQKRLIMDSGAIFSVDAGKQLYIRGTVDAGMHKIFAGAGTVSFSTYPQVDKIPVTWFGADPTYGFDSSPAFTAAMAAANASAMPVRVYVPAGQYMITNTITVPNRAVLEGEQLSTSLYYTAQTNNTFAVTFASPSDNVRIKGLAVVNYPKAGITGTGGIGAISTNFSSISEIFLDDVFIEGFDRYGILLDRVIYPKLNRVRVMRTRSKTAAYPGVGICLTNYSAALAMRECRVNSNDAAFLSGKLNGATFDSCYFEMNGDMASAPKDTISINGGLGITMAGCYFEGNFTGKGATDALLRFENCSGVHVSGSTFAGDYGTTTNTMNFAYIAGSSRGVVFNGNNMMCPISGFILTDATAATVNAHKNSYFVGKSTTPLVRYEDVAARMTANSVDVDVPSAFTWTPGVLADGDMTSVTVPVAGARKGRRDQVLAHFDNFGANDMIMNGYVESDGYVRVVLENHSGQPLTIGAGTLSIRLQKFD